MIIHEQSKLNQVLKNELPVLFMFPFAGGNTYSYRGIIERLEEDYNVVCLEYPGRGNLINEPMIANISELVDYLFERWIKPISELKDCLFFGHSLGALLAYLSTHKIMEYKMHPPMYLILSGSAAPWIQRRHTSGLTSEEFWQYLKEKGGIAREIIENSELRNFFEPILRADFKLLENYQYHEQKTINIPITVLYGTEDAIENQSIQLWQKETVFPLEMIEMKGDHFFIFKNKTLIGDIIRQLIIK